MTVFVDSNIPMYVAGRDHPLRNPARRFLQRARAGEFDIATSAEVLQEILYRYSSLKRLDLAGAVYDLFVEVCPTVWPITIADTDRARAILLDTRTVSARDALQAAIMLNNGVSRIATFDAGFDAIDGIQRVALGD